MGILICTTKSLFFSLPLSIIVLKRQQEESSNPVTPIIYLSETPD